MQQLLMECLELVYFKLLICMNYVICHKF
uniref:Uncharacterized protein n=1 Tax=Schistosoma japonicum TaxID=6182 RepID=Q5C2J7_SCHJA|nr:unknown [Schistosoma japonicum]